MGIALRKNSNRGTVGLDLDGGFVAAVQASADGVTRAASFTSPIPIPRGWTSAATNRKVKAAAPPIRASGRKSVRRAAVAPSPHTPSGRRILLGMIRCSRSMYATATSIAANGSSSARSASTPFATAMTAKTSPVVSSTSG